MTVASTVRRVSYIGSGSPGPFTIPFRFFSADDLRVIVRTEGVEDELTNGVDFTTTGARNASGTLTLTSALANGTTLSIARVPALTQGTSLRNQGTFYGAAHEDQFDVVAMQLQGVDDKAERAIKLAPSIDPTDFSLELEPEPGKALVWQDATTLGNATLDSGAIAVPGNGRTVDTFSGYAANNAVVNVKDYGEGGATVGTGIDDDMQAFRNAVAALPNGGKIVVPRATYIIRGQVAITHDNISIEFEKGATVVANVLAADVAVFVADNRNGVQVAGLTISGAFPWAIYVSGGTGLRIRDCVISGGTVPQSGKCGGIYIESVTDFLIDRVKASGNGVVTGDAGADIQCNNGDTMVTDGIIRDCTLTSTLVTINCCVYNPLRVLVDNVRVSGARVFASSPAAGGYGILFYRTSGTVASTIGHSRISRCTASATQGVGLNVQGDVPYAHIIDSKSISCCTTQTGASLTVGGIVHEGSHGMVANCDSVTSGSHGIAVGGSFNNGRVQACRASAPALDGIIFNGALSDSTIENCDVDTIGGHLAYGPRNFVDMATVRCAIRNCRAVNVGSAAYFSPSSDGCIIEDVISTGLADETYIALNQGTNAVVRRNIGNNTHFPESVSGDRGDANVVVVHGRDFQTQLFRTALSTTRTVTLSTINVKNGARFRFVKQASGGAGGLDVGGLKTIAAGAVGFVDVEYAIVPGVGAFWILTGYGTW